jgi:hypothetical protein
MTHVSPWWLRRKEHVAPRRHVSHSVAHLGLCRICGYESRMSFAADADMRQLEDAP